MSDHERFSKSPADKKVQILSPEKMEEVIEELTRMRGDTDTEIDSLSIDNAIRLCEKIDINFEHLNESEKLLILQNYDFFSSSYQFTLFLQLMFRGGLSTKERTFRALSKKLKATYEVTQCIMSTKILFDSLEIEEIVRDELKAFIDTMLNAFSNMILPSIRLKTKDPLSINWLQNVLAQHQPIFDDSEVSYEQVTRLFSDLIYTLFSHDKLPYYLKWKDNYLKHWLVYMLREEDRFDNSSIPALSAAKADLYGEYISWTKIAKRLNANLRHRQSFDNETSIRAEKVLLERLPSNILLELVWKLRQKMKTTPEVPEVDLGIEDDSIDEIGFFTDMVGNILEQEEPSPWLGRLMKKMKEAFIPKMKEAFIPKIKEAKEISKLIERAHPEGLLETQIVYSMLFSEKFPQDYSGDIPKQFSLFFTRSRTNYFDSFEESLLEILMVYEEKDMMCIKNTPRIISFGSGKKVLEFEEHCLLIKVDENLLMLGNTHFKTTQNEHLIHPSPYGYFKWFKKINIPNKEQRVCVVNGQSYEEVPLNEIGVNKEALVGLHRVINSLPDYSYEKAPVQQLLSFLDI